MSKYYMNSNKKAVTKENKKTTVVTKEFYFPPLPTNKKNTTTLTTPTLSEATFGLTTPINYLLKAKANVSPIISNRNEDKVKWSKDDFYEPDSKTTVKWSDVDFCDDDEYYEDDYEEEDRQFRNQYEDRCDPIEWDD